MVATSLKKAATPSGAKYTKKHHFEVSEVRQVATGQARLIHTSQGLKIPATHKKHTPCEGCGGRDRFRIANDYETTGRWLCGGGGNFQSGDVFGLPMHVFGWSFTESLASAAKILGLEKMDASERQRIKEASQRARQRLQLEAMQRTELARQDSYLLDCLFECESALKERQGQRVLEPTSNELFKAARLCGALEQHYGGLKS